MTDDVERFLSVLRLACRQAGAVARHLQGEVRDVGKAGMATPESTALTAADLAAQEVLLLALAEAFPGWAVDAEEDTETARLFPPEDGARPVVVLDPIDGTYNYARRSPDYGVMAGLIVDGRYRAAVVGFPEHRELLWATEDRGVHGLAPGTGPAPVPLAPPCPRAVVAPDVDGSAQAALGALGLQVEVSRCSAVDGVAPVRSGASSVSGGILDRRRGIALYVTVAAGGTVLVGGSPWRGEDPRSLASAGPSVAAGTPELARRIHRAVTGGPATGD